MRWELATSVPELASRTAALRGSWLASRPLSSATRNGFAVTGLIQSS